MILKLLFIASLFLFFDKKRLHKVLYNMIYVFSYCQLKYKKISNYVTPYIKYYYNNEHKTTTNDANPATNETNPATNETKTTINDNDDLNKKIQMIMFYNNTTLVKKHNADINVNDLNLFIKNEEPLVYNLMIIGIYSQTKWQQMNMLIFRQLQINDTLIDFTNINTYETTNYKFIALVLTHETKIYQIQLQTSEYNYYVVDNIIDKVFLQNYLFNVLNVNIETNINNFTYSLEIMDENVNMFTLNETQSIIFKKDNYIIQNSDLDK